MSMISTRFLQPHFSRTQCLRSEYSKSQQGLFLFVIVVYKSHSNSNNAMGHAMLKMHMHCML